MACDRTAKSGLTLVLEPINHRDIPGYFTNTTDQVKQIIEEVGAPHLKLQLDLYHMQVTEGDLQKRTERLFPITAHVQIAGNPDRNEPDIGEANHLYLLDVLDRLGYDGYVGLEYKPKTTTGAGLGWAAQVRHQGLIMADKNTPRRRLHRPGLDGPRHGEEPAEARPQGDRRRSQRRRRARPSPRPAARSPRRPAEAAATADVVIVAVVNAQQVETVLFGDGGAVATLRKGGLVMQCATVPRGLRQVARRAAGQARPRAARRADVGRPRARRIGRAHLHGLGRAGRPSRRPRASSPATSAKVFRLGDAPGIGSLVKTVNQLLAGVHIATAAEAMALAAKAGADTRAVYEVISASAGNSWMFGNRVPHMLDDDYSPLSAVEIFVKDLGLVLNTGHEHRLPLPMAAAAHQLFLAAAGAGWGRLDDAAVVKVYEQAGDFKVSSPKK